MDIISYLREALAPSFPGVTISSAVPPTRPLPLIVISRSGGTYDRSGIDYPFITIRVYAKSEAEAYKLALKVRAAMVELEDNDELSSVSANGLALLSSSPEETLYQLTFNILSF